MQFDEEEVTKAIYMTVVGIRCQAQMSLLGNLWLFLMLLLLGLFLGKLRQRISRTIS